jgi:hypothetical protein
MTPSGIYGSDIEAETWEEADAKAEAPPFSYKVLDWFDHLSENVLVIEGDEERDAHAEHEHESRYRAPQGPFADND